MLDHSNIQSDFNSFWKLIVVWVDIFYVNISEGTNRGWIWKEYINAIMENF